MWHPWLILGGLAVGGFLLFASFVPLAGAAGFNVNVTVTSQEISYVVANQFSISQVSGSSNGASPLWAWTAGLSTGPSALYATFTMTVCVATSHCASKSQMQWFPTVPFVNGQQLQATNTFGIGNVPSGQQSISVVLTQSGQTVATGSGSICVGC